jgi:pimeloyl-ACP methyl ester carboxylesterase
VPLPSGLSDAALMRVLYLHGFASSPRSTKAEYFGERLRPYGIELECPDFNLPDFSTLTITRMLEDLDSRITGGDRVAVIGSSLGGALAVLAAARYPAQIQRVVMLAPAVMFAKPGHHLLPHDRIDEWRRRGAMPFFHYAHGQEQLLNWSFYEDTLRYDPFETVFTQPSLIYQGRGDTSVDPQTVEAFARTRPNVTLTLLDDDHQLTASLPTMWSGIQSFLGLTS